MTVHMGIHHHAGSKGTKIMLITLKMYNTVGWQGNKKIPHDQFPFAIKHYVVVQSVKLCKFSYQHGQ